MCKSFNWKLKEHFETSQEHLKKTQKDGSVTLSVVDKKDLEYS